tara:strand:+ start:235 stop:960 length:726 start_codon:yes stop_codon:yes gene_type:complete
MQKKYRKIGIPPAYKNVCISSNPHSKVQGTATDANGNVHYYYSEAHKHAARKNRKKRARLIRPDKIDTYTKRILSRKSMMDDREWDGALALRMINKCYMRSGAVNRPTGNVGALTLAPRHVSLGRRNNHISFRYPGKSGVARRCDIRDPVLYRALRMVKKSRRPRLTGGATREMVSEMIREIHGNNTLKIKDIRTSAGMRMYRKHMVGRDPANKKDVREALKKTATILGHSPAVCKKFYAL